MTTIVGIYTEGQGVVMGADTKISTESMSDFMPTGQRKLITHNGWVIGAAGHLRTLGLVEEFKDFLFDGLTRIQELPPRLHEMLSENGYTPGGDNEYGGPKCFGQQFMVGSVNGLWNIDVSLAVRVIASSALFATGSGQEYALGSGHSTQSIKQPAKRLQLALESAVRYDPRSGGRFDFIEVRPGKRNTKQEIATTVIW